MYVPHKIPGITTAPHPLSIHCCSIYDDRRYGYTSFNIFVIWSILLYRFLNGSTIHRCSGCGVIFHFEFSFKGTLQKENFFFFIPFSFYFLYCVEESLINKSRNYKSIVCLWHRLYWKRTRRFFVLFLKWMTLQRDVGRRTISFPFSWKFRCSFIFSLDNRKVFSGAERFYGLFIFPKLFHIVKSLIRSRYFGLLHEWKRIRF